MPLSVHKTVAKKGGGTAPSGMKMTNVNEVFDMTCFGDIPTIE